MRKTKLAFKSIVFNIEYIEWKRNEECDHRSCNCNLSNCELSPQKRFLGLQRESYPWQYIPAIKIWNQIPLDFITIFQWVTIGYLELSYWVSRILHFLSRSVTSVGSNQCLSSQTRVITGWPWMKTRHNIAQLQYWVKLLNFKWRWHTLRSANNVVFLR